MWPAMNRSDAWLWRWKSGQLPCDGRFSVTWSTPFDTATAPTVLAGPTGQRFHRSANPSGVANEPGGKTSSDVFASRMRRSASHISPGSCGKRKCSVPVPSTLPGRNSKVWDVHADFAAIIPLFMEPKKNRGGIGFPSTWIWGPPRVSWTRTVIRGRTRPRPGRGSGTAKHIASLTPFHCGNRPRGSRSRHACRNPSTAGRAAVILIGRVRLEGGCQAVG